MREKIKSSTLSTLTTCIILACGYLQTSKAAIVIVDNIDTNDLIFSTSVIDSHGDTYLGHSGRILLNGSGGDFGIFITGLDVGTTSSTNAFTQSGGTISVDNTPADLFVFEMYLTSGVFVNGSTSGINYARFGGNAVRDAGNFYIVVEFDFGVNEDFSDDVITRYAYENEFENPHLTVAAAEAAFATASVPEPSSSALFSLGTLGLLLRRRR